MFMKIFAVLIISSEIVKNKASAAAIISKNELDDDQNTSINTLITIEQENTKNYEIGQEFKQRIRSK